MCRRGREMRIHNTSGSFLPGAIVSHRGSSLLCCLASSAGGLSCKQRGTFSSALFKAFVLFPCPSPSVAVFSTARLSPAPTLLGWRPCEGLLAYWAFRCQWGRKDPAGLSASLTPPSQWLRLPPTHFPASLGRVNIYHPPLNNGRAAGEGDFDRASGLEKGCREIRMEPAGYVTW